MQTCEIFFHDVITKKESYTKIRNKAALVTKKANAVIESKTMLTEVRTCVEKSAIAVDSQEMFLKVFSC